MTIPSQILALINQLNQELDLIEQEATGGLNQVIELLFLFSGNAILLQFFGSLNNYLLFVEFSRRQIQTTVETISPTDVPAEVIQDAGEDLGTLMGRVLEAKIGVRRIINR